MVEVDSETGAVRVLRFVAVDDCGRIVNPKIVEGQQQGGIVQGVAQALYEQVVHDAAGNIQTSTFADYGIPSAAELPAIEVTTINAVAREPARRKGNRAGGRDRVDDRGAERGDRRGRAPRRPPHRSPAHRGTCVARDRGRGGGKRCQSDAVRLSVPAPVDA